VTDERDELKKAIMEHLKALPESPNPIDSLAVYHQHGAAWSFSEQEFQAVVREAGHDIGKWVV
jgi:hypothetical protein